MQEIKYGITQDKPGVIYERCDSFSVLIPQISTGVIPGWTVEVNVPFTELWEVDVSEYVKDIMDWLHHKRSSFKANR